MDITNKNFDGGKSFDFGRTSEAYAKYRDIYPDDFYEHIAERGLCIKGQKVLDLGTGTGVLPRNMYHYGAKWTGVDISENQIAYAERLAKEKNQNINFVALPVEKVSFSKDSFDVITACQCFGYFDHEKVMPKLADMLKTDGRLLILYMAWLPFEDETAKMSENLVLKYNPAWTGAKETMKKIDVPSCTYHFFEPVYHEEYKLDVPFTRETWHGRMKSCRGIGASLSSEEIEKWEFEHKAMLEKIAPNEFTIKHYAAMLELRKK
ncbi:MAG: class I SAM-dependent methyltransferase [Faecalibacterium sp.]|nr:class I SAM-dependent methyltransferase [Ruminococcus sp.]MCM1392068.1 class I SAM-dependent methyltransferase [Ruminococcus sp.]MCM1484993.1 class I SAM-dependent methyltransferase [Faecalibacterium sp.]